MRSWKNGHHCKPRSRRPGERRGSWKKGKKAYKGQSSLTPGRSSS